MERLSDDIDFLIGDLWAINQRALNSDYALPPLKKEIERAVEPKVLKKLFKLDLIKVEHFKTRKGARACIMFTEKGREYCGKYHADSTIIL